MNGASASATPSGVADVNSVRVLVVDDALVVRGILCRMLDEASDISVAASASDGARALARLMRTPVDVIILDVDMPNMDGISALPHIVEQHPGIPVIMVSTLSKRNAEISVRALELGAADHITRPSSSSDFAGADAFKKELQDKVRSLGRAAQRRARHVIPTSPTAPFRAARTQSPRPAPPASAKDTPPAVRLRPLRPFMPEAIAIGSSTGGPQALMRIVKDIGQIPQPIFITQHMPATFTAILADHIGVTAGRTCVEGGQGTPVERHGLYLAPGNRHMIIERRGGKPVITLSDGPPENFCRPAVDPMLRSLAETYGGGLLVAILTGMGSDGAKGAVACVDAGGQVLAQDEATSVVWGMPGAAARAGICSAIEPLSEIGRMIRNFALEGGNS